MNPRLSEGIYLSNYIRLKPIKQTDNKQVLVIAILTSLFLTSIPLINYIRKCLHARQLLGQFHGIYSWHFLFSGVDNKTETPVQFTLIGLC